MQDHRKLRVWRHAHDLAIAVRQACRSLPRIGYASLHAQATRSAESIVFNIVEGCGSASQRELARFIDISIKSASELESQLELARDYGVLPVPVWGALSTDTTNARRMLHGLRAKVLATLKDERRKRRPERRHAKRSTPDGERTTP